MICCNLARESDDFIRHALDESGIALCLLRALEDLKDAKVTNIVQCSQHKSLLAALWNFSADNKEIICSYANTTDLIMWLIGSNDDSLILYATGIMRNLSRCLAKSSENCKKLSKDNNIKLLVKQFLHSDLDIVNNTAGIIWNLSACDKKIQEQLLDLGIIKLLDDLIFRNKNKLFHRKDLLKAFYSIQCNLMLARADRKKVSSTRSFRYRKQQVVVTSVLSFHDYECYNQLLSINEENARGFHNNDRRNIDTSSLTSAQQDRQSQVRSDLAVENQATIKSDIKNVTDAIKSSANDKSIPSPAISTLSNDKISPKADTTTDPCSSQLNSVVIKENRCYNIGNTRNGLHRSLRSVKYRESRA